MENKMYNNTVPIIRLEVEGMKHTVQMMLSKYAAELDKEVFDAVEKFCTSSNIERVINECTEKSIKQAIELEIGDFFRYGNGRKAIKEAVENQLNGIYKD